MNSTELRLNAIRGPVPPQNHNARTIAALTGNPGCTRRAVMDAAGIDKKALAARIGFHCDCPGRRSSSVPLRNGQR